MYVHCDLTTMDTSGIYDIGPMQKPQQLKQACMSRYSQGDKLDLVTDLGASEISLDLHNLIDFNDGFFPDQQRRQSQALHSHAASNAPSPPAGLTSGGTVTTNDGAIYHHQPSINLYGQHQQYQFQPSPPVKNEPEDFSPLAPHESSLSGSPCYTPDRDTPDYEVTFANIGRPDSVCSSKDGNFRRMRGMDKASEEYRRRRERNNVAVRKSREKAKIRSRETEEKVKGLLRDNDRLQKRCDLLTEEVTILRSLFCTVGGLPDAVQREVSRRLESIQQRYRQPLV